MAKTVFEAQIGEIVRQRTALMESMVGGAAKDYAHYREMVGIVRGLDTVRRYIEDLSQSYLENDDE